MVIQFTGISHVLLDIEGTTCPVSFVAATLFPYATSHLQEFLDRHHQEPAIQRLLQQLAQHQRSTPHQLRIPHQLHIPPQHLHTVSPPPASEPAQPTNTQTPELDSAHATENPLTTEALPALVAYAEALIKADVKVTPLKDLQGRIWSDGYAKGELISPLFADVPPCLHAWKQQGLVLAVYSSGSVAAQQLLYQFSNAGDLTGLFQHWFDTHQGPKHFPASYSKICQTMDADPRKVLFISDSPAELEAARAAGLHALSSERPGNPLQAGQAFPFVQDFRDLLIRPFPA